MGQNILCGACYCHECGERQNVEGQDIKTMTGTVQGRTDNITVMYTECRKCGSIIVLQADSEKTENLKKRATDVLLHDLDKRKKGTSKNFRTLSKELTGKRKKLNKKLNGRKMYDKEGKLFIKSLTFGI